MANDYDTTARNIGVDAIASTEPATTGKAATLRIVLVDDRVVEITIPMPLYAQDIVRIMSALGQVWGQMPAEQLPSGEQSRLVVARGTLPPPPRPS